MDTPPEAAPRLRRRRALQFLASWLAAGAGSTPLLLGWPRRVLAASAAADPDWQLSDAAWRARLPASAYAVLRQEATERPFSSPLESEKRKGTYLCAGCRLPLFSSSRKYDSGTGWPSFWEALPGAVASTRDFKLLVPRTEYHCRRCGGHQGHVFNDGPRPSGKRFCNNGVALLFVPG